MEREGVEVSGSPSYFRGSHPEGPEGRKSSRPHGKTSHFLNKSPDRKKPGGAHVSHGKAQAGGSERDRVL